jgi:hypothetical protein
MNNFKFEWFNVKDTLPPKEGDYLFTDGDKMDVDRFCYQQLTNGDDRPQFGLYDRLCGTVTHWAYLPKLPNL